MSFKKVIILLGFPNTGKTSLFNTFTSLNQKVVNYPGATVDIMVGPLIGHEDILVVDTPGLLSLTPRSDDEQVARDVLFKLDSMVSDVESDYEVVLCALSDLTQSTRHLAFIKPFLDSRYRTVIAFNKQDISQKLGEVVNVDAINKELPCSSFTLSVRENEGVSELTQALVSAFTNYEKPDPLPQSQSKQTVQDHYRWATSIVSSGKRTPEKESFDLDRFVLHPILGIFVFFAIMVFFFYSIFSLSAPLMDGVDAFFGFLMTGVSDHFPNSFLTEFVTDGLIAGVGGVIIFVPQLFILFLCIGAMESSGFLARASMLIDKPLSKIGLNGRSFVPLLSGFACAIPALMAARTIPGKKERFLSMFIIPLMQCSARLPVYGLLIALLFRDNLGQGALFLTGIYIASILISFVIAAIGSMLLKGGKSIGFQMELPRWQLPEWRPLLQQATIQTLGFIKNAGPIILITSILLWFFSVFPNPDQSLLMSVGKIIEPIFLPMGVDWRVGVALLMSFVAREVFVSALVIIFSISSEETESIISALQTATFEGTSTPIFTTPTIMGLVAFFMISMQCLSTFAVAKKEMKSWTLAVFQLVFYVVLGYASAVLIYQVLS